jgi:predicted esterase
VSTDWCTASVNALDEETCFVLPAERTDTLLIYLHGIVPPTKESRQKTNFEAVVANASGRARVAALLPRGDLGLAGPKYREWWGWPTGEPGYRAHGARLVKKIGEKRAALERVAGARFERVYVAGSSAGAYFVAALALHGAIEADGFGAMSGGAGWRTPELAKLPPKRFYVGYGAYDSVASSARALGELLRAAGWPVRVAEHPLGHGAKEIYLDEAFAFWRGD